MNKKRKLTLRDFTNHKTWRAKAIWIGLGALTLLIRLIFAANPNLTESVYSRGIFQVIRFFLDYTIGLIPIATLYLIAAAAAFSLVLIILKRIKKGKKIKEKKTWPARILGGVLSSAAFFGAAIFIFHFIWGFNYQRLAVEDHLKINVEPLNMDGIRKEANIAFTMLTAARKDIPGASEAALDSSFIPQGLESRIRNDLKNVLISMGYPAPGRVRARKIWPAGLLMHFGISGIYFLFTGEAYLPANLIAVAMPFTMAHEMAHGFGFTEEGAANFLAYLACISSKDPVVRYSGCLNYFSYISSELFNASREEYRTMMKKLPRGIIADRRALFEYWERYRSRLMAIAEEVNDVYLKSQGVKEGVKSYSRMVILAAAWRATSGESAAWGSPPVGVRTQTGN
jgi:hypothetical protein